MFMEIKSTDRICIGLLEYVGGARAKPKGRDEKNCDGDQEKINVRGLVSRKRGLKEAVILNMSLSEEDSGSPTTRTLIIMH